ncbi:MvdC/MvdD family ATP grasp protein [Streptomyces griseus]|uniref:MvdC/MvdD family ATP grasp protein n=1 Tax=Streptomyces griseus TaxID=1911 RepID=UPI00368FB9A8
MSRPVDQDGDTVLVITARDSDTGDAVTLALQDLGVRTARFDLADLGRTVSVSARCDDGQWQGSLTVRSRVTRLRDVRSVFWCHPTPPRVWAESMTQAQVRWASHEALAGLVGVLGCLACLHVNHPDDFRRAQIKAGVITAAEGAGLNVPPTWIGNLVSGARRFDLGAEGGIVSKTLTVPQIDEDDYQIRPLYTTPVVDSDLGAVQTGITYLQHRVLTEYAVRAHTIGTRTIAVRIDAHTTAGRADWRAAPESLTYSSITLPAPVGDALNTLVHGYGLSYAVSDFVVDSHGRWYFVDLNPAGQYRWLEAALPDLGITEALAQLLIGGTGCPGLNGRTAAA